MFIVIKLSVILCYYSFTHVGYRITKAAVSALFEPCLISFTI